MDPQTRVYWKDYLRELLTVCWRALERTDTLVIFAFIASGIVSLWLGTHSEHPSWQIAFVIFLFSLFFLLARMPYKLYIQQRMTIERLRERLTPRIKVFVHDNGVREETDPTKSKWIQIGVSCATESQLEDCEVWLISAKKICKNHHNNDDDELANEKLHCV
jgi:hypothetical protein